MKERDVKTGEKVLVLGVGQLGAAVLKCLIPAVTKHNGAVSVIVSPDSRDKQGNLQSDTHQNWLIQGPNLSLSMSLPARLTR